MFTTRTKPGSPFWTPEGQTSGLPFWPARRSGRLECSCWPGGQAMRLNRLP